MSETGDVLFEVVNNAGVITLNKPKRLNTITGAMVATIHSKLRQWETNVSLVVIKAAGNKVFSAGGDLLNMRGKRHKFSEEIRTDLAIFSLIYTYPVPYVALIDGVTIGGGAGMAVPGRYRVATERTVYGMPEVLVGYVPDTSSSYFLSRMPHNLGVYIALTARFIKGGDNLWTGVATHYVESSNLPKLEAQLLLCKNNFEVEKSLNEFSIVDRGEFSLAPVLDKIERCFGVDSVEDIVLMLKRDGSDWAREVLVDIGKASPVSLKVTLRELRLARNLPIGECMNMEYRITRRMLSHENFQEGVRALVIDKDRNPKWTPATLEEVSDEMVDSYFANLPDHEELNHKL